MKIKLTVEVQEMTNGFLDLKFDLFFTLIIDNKIIFKDQDRVDAISKIDNHLYSNKIKEQIKEKIYESMNDSISKIFFTNDYQYTLSEVNL